MTATQRLLTTLPALGCLAGLLAADEAKKPRTIIVTPSVFYSGSCERMLDAISPDGKYVAFVPMPPNNLAPDLQVFSVATKKVVARLDLRPISVSFTPDSTRLLCEWAEASKIPLAHGVWHVEVSDAKTGKTLHEIQLKPGQPVGGGDVHGGAACAFTDDILVAGGSNEVATVYDLKTGKAVGDLPRGNPPSQFALSANGRWLVTADRKGEVHTWDVNARKHDRKLCDAGFIRCLAISPDGRWCAVARKNRTSVFDRTTGREMTTEDRPGVSGAYSLIFSPDGKRIVGLSHVRKVMSAARGGRTHGRSFASGPDRLEACPVRG